MTGPGEPDAHDTLGAADGARVQQSALRVAVWVGVASIAVLGIITALIVTAMVAGSRVDRPPGHGHGPRRVVELDAIVPFAVTVAVLGVVALALVAWFVSRRATRPLAEALSVQRAFVADASHELRTPLTTLTSRIQLAQHRAARGGDIEPILGELRRDAAVMDAVLTDMLQAAEAAGTTSGDAHAIASADAAARDAIGIIAPRAQAAGVTLALGAPTGLEVRADHTALTRALVALVDNAVRHSPAGGTVSISSRAAGRRLELRVTDQGGGVTGIDPDRLFDRFARSSDAPSTTGSRGFGLGLALVRDTVTRFGGTVALEQTGPAGSTFLITLPLRHPQNGPAQNAS